MKEALILIAVIFLPAMLLAVDELYLTGTVINYEPDTGKIRIDVINSSCKGVREFITQKGLPKQLLINKTVDFAIDSNHCDNFKTYSITTPLLDLN